MESNKIVLVTGGSKNLGKYIANFFLNLNCHVICVSKNTLSNLKSDNYLLILMLFHIL